MENLLHVKFCQFDILTALRRVYRMGSEFRKEWEVKCSALCLLSAIKVKLFLCLINEAPCDEDLWEWRYSSTILDLSTR
jgi:hypothetical protein